MYKTFSNYFMSFYSSYDVDMCDMIFHKKKTFRKVLKRRKNNITFVSVYGIISFETNCLAVYLLTTDMCQYILV